MKTKIFGKIKFPSLGGVRGGFFLPLLGRGLGGGFLLLWGLGGSGVLLAQTPNLLVCADKGYTIKNATEASGKSSVSYKWYEKVNEDAFAEVSDETTASLHRNAKESAGTYAYVRMAFSEDCEGGVASNTFTVVVLKPETPVVTPTAAAVCEGTEVIFAVTSPVAGATYSWSGDTGTPTGDDNSTYTVSGAAYGTKGVYAAASFTYTVGTLTPKTCVSDLSTLAQAEVNPLPTVTTVGSTAFCGTTTSHQLQVKAEVGESADGVAVAWYDNNAGTGEALSNATTYTPEALTTTAVTYYVKATVNNTGCVNAPLYGVSASLSLDEGTIGGEENSD